MNTVKIYDKVFAELGITGAFIRLEYTKGFREAGSAELTLSLDDPAAEYFTPDGYFSVPDGTFYIIESVKRDMRAGEMYVRGKGLLSIFGGTVIGEEYSLTGQASTILCAIARQGAANMPIIFGLENVSGGNQITVSSGRSYLYDDLVSACYMGNIGMQLCFGDGKLVFSPRLPRDRTASSDDPVTVSRRLGNLDCERLLWDFSSYRNVAVVSGTEKESGGRYTVTVRSDSIGIGDSFPDPEYFDRQMLVNFTSPVRPYMFENAEGLLELDETAYTNAMYLSGAAALGRCRPKLYLYGSGDSDILPGDRVTVSDTDSGISGTALSERMTVVYSPEGKSVTTELCAESAYKPHN